MARSRRPHAPGSPFHITARTQGRAHLFTEPLRDKIADYICDAAASSTTQLLACAVMPNHLHIIVRQGAQPLGWMMQRVLQRTAWLVRRTHSHEGHVFGARYWSGLCDDARYLRQVIIYTHLNPYYAGLCKDPEEYPWTTHGAYAGIAGASPWSMHLCVDHGLRLFASGSLDRNTLRSDYRCFIEYWMKRERLPLGAKYLFTEADRSVVPHANGGDQFWNDEYGDVVIRSPSCCTRPAIDLHRRATIALRGLAEDLTLDQIRSAGRVKAVSVIRGQLTATLLTDGYGNGAIARFLNVSTAYVSTISAAIRIATSKDRYVIAESDARDI